MNRALTSAVICAAVLGLTAAIAALHSERAALNEPDIIEVAEEERGPAPLNPRTGAKVVLPVDWDYEPDIVVLGPTLNFGMFNQQNSDALAQYGCERRPEIETVAGFKTIAQGYVAAIRWNEASLKHHSPDVLEIAGIVTKDDGELRSIAMLVVKINDQFCSLTYRLPATSPDAEGIQVLADAIFGPGIRPAGG